MRIFIVFTTLFVALVAAAEAQPVVSLASGDLSALRLGDPVTIEIELSGLSGGDTLELLAAEIVYDAARFGLPTITPDVIIPDVSGFTADEFPGLAGATFDMLDTGTGTDTIAANGLFFTFEMVPLTIGSGEIAVDFADALGIESGGNPIDGALAGAPLAYQVLPDCDFTGDGLCDIDDLDPLISDIAAMTNTPMFDLSGDGSVDLVDRDEWLAQAGMLNLPSELPYLLADFNLDGFVDGSDFLVWNSNKFSATGTWSQGDANADGVTDGADFLVWNANKFLAPDGGRAVPEPTGIAIVLTLVCVGYLHRMRP